jgi:hypothetical protein
VKIIKEELKAASYFSISTDASNHKAEKIFPLVIQYFTRKGTQIRLLKLSSLKSVTSDAISSFCIEALRQHQLDFSKYTRIAFDNANVNFGGLGRLGKNNTFTK